MADLDYKAIFARVLYEELGEAFMRHGIDAIYEDELDEIVIGVTRSEYFPCVQEFRKTYGLNMFDRPKPAWMGRYH